MLFNIVSKIILQVKLYIFVFWNVTLFTQRHCIVQVHVHVYIYVLVHVYIHVYVQYGHDSVSCCSLI